MQHDTEIEKQNPNSAEGLITRLEQYDKEFVSRFAPDDGNSRKKEFLDDDAAGWPKKNYPRLTEADFGEIIADLEDIRTGLANANIPDKYLPAYQAQVEEYIKVNQLMQAAQTIRSATDESDRQQVTADYQRLNIELYGVPEEDTYRVLLSEKLQAIKRKELTGEAADLREKLFSAMGGGVDLEDTPGKWQPDPETVKWVHDTATLIVEPLNRQLPIEIDSYEFADDEAVDQFDTNIKNTFAEAADGWHTESNPDKAGMDVSPRERTVSVPLAEKRAKGALTINDFRNIVNPHELAVHMMRSLMGEQMDLGALRTGLAGYYSTEEGLGKVMEQALAGKYEDGDEIVKAYYLVAGLSYFDHKDPTEIFQILSDIEVLSSVPDGTNEIPNQTMDKARSDSYNRVQRIYRGTDEFPVYKDIAYYVGAQKIWRYLDSIADHPNRDELFQQLFSGKYDPTNPEHEAAFASVGPNMDYGLSETGRPLTEAEQSQLRHIAGKFVVDRELIKSISH